MTILITSIGFTGAHFVFDWLAQSDESVINFYKLEALASLQGDMGESELLATLERQQGLKMPACFAHDFVVASQSAATSTRRSTTMRRSFPPKTCTGLVSMAH